jgi:hypothetical protein
MVDREPCRDDGDRAMSIAVDDDDDGDAPKLICTDC